jgi:hypothetical protein
MKQRSTFKLFQLHYAFEDGHIYDADRHVMDGFYISEMGRYSGALSTECHSLDVINKYIWK